MLPRRRYYIVYRTVNLLNGRYYIGAHETDVLDDGYLGSGKLLKRALKKYGTAAFRRTIIARCPNRRAMYRLEKQLVSLILNDPLSYNLAPGGRGGFTVKTTKIRAPQPMSDATKLKLSAIRRVQTRGAGNSQHGTAWLVHDERELVVRVKLVEVDALVERGWRRGRVMRYRMISSLETES